jgi:transposase-like protein
MKKQRKQYTQEEKVGILWRHLLDKEPVSKLCDEIGLKPTVFYRWQKEFFQNGACAFEQKRPTNHSAEQERISDPEKKIQTKIDAGRLIVWVDIAASQFYYWRDRYGKVNEHNGWFLRDFWAGGLG